MWLVRVSFTARTCPCTCRTYQNSETEKSSRVRSIGQNVIQEACTLHIRHPVHLSLSTLRVKGQQCYSVQPAVVCRCVRVLPGRSTLTPESNVKADLTRWRILSSSSRTRRTISWWLAQGTEWKPGCTRQRKVRIVRQPDDSSCWSIDDFRLTLLFLLLWCGHDVITMRYCAFTLFYSNAAIDDGEFAHAYCTCRCYVFVSRDFICM